MKPRFLLRVLRTAVLLAATTSVVSYAAPSIPHLQRNGEATQLMVDGQPFLVLGGELHNSSSTSRAYMAPIWPKLAQMNLNTVLAVVPWDAVEPAEGTFDFSMVDELIADARANDLRLILLWFGSWKNGFSHYVPDWVKADSERFPRALTRYGTPEILSTFSDANRDADSRAFAAFMRHLREIDEAERTVLMIQVENEIGLHADSRDRSATAETAWNSAVPAKLIDYLQANREDLLVETRELWQKNGFHTAGTWAEVFGTSPAAEEAFMGWHYAQYVERVAAAGKDEYALPTYVNAWIVQLADEYPGDYPAGGPQAHMLDLWRAGAPHLDLLAPDIYRANFAGIAEDFMRRDNPLFVPESRAGFFGAGNAFVTFGRYKGIGYSPFGIESREPAGGAIHHAYDVLRQLTPLILQHQTTGTITAAILTKENPSEHVSLGGYNVTLALRSGRRVREPPERGFGLAIATGPGEFIVAGANLQVSFGTDPPSDEVVGLATVEEGVFADGQWVRGRILNGDEIMLSYDVPTTAATRQTGTGLRFNGETPTIQRVTLYRYPQAH